MLRPRYALYAALLVAACAATVPDRAVRAPADGPRALVIMVDGVPFEVMDSLHRKGHFSDFSRPSQVISPFPTLTGVAFTTAWGAEPRPGYEDRYFDRSANRMRGGVLDHFFGGGEQGFHRHVDLETDGVTEAAIYLFPGRLAHMEIESFREALDERLARDDTVVAYIVSTDALAHREGREAVVDYMHRLDVILSDTRARHGGELELILFSDHGNELVPTRRVRLEPALETAGFRVAASLDGDRDVVIPKFGMVGSAFLYARPGAERRLAMSLRDVPGVELIIFRETSDGASADVTHVWSADGRATVEADPAAGWYAYRPETGDPLGLAPALARMRAAGRADRLGRAPDEAWLEASRETPYIDSVRRIHHAFDGVENGASLIVSLAPGFHSGSPAADLVADVSGTHGSLRTASSLAFFMRTGPPAPATLRAGELRRLLPGRQP